MRFFLGLCTLAAAALVYYSEPSAPAAGDQVAQAFAQYQREWRLTAGRCAESLESGAISTESEAHTFLSKAQPIIRRRAFARLAATEAEMLSPWSAAAHASLLRGYK